MSDQKNSTIHPLGSYVGKLEELWQFPSDHLPIGLSIGDLHIASWNVLDSKYMWWVTKRNSQGLQKSMLADEHTYIGKTKLTIRDQHVIDNVLEMLTHTTHPRSILSLQECGLPFLDELKAKLPTHFSSVAKGGCCVIIDASRFDLIHEEFLNIFLDEPKRTIQNLILQDRDSRQFFRIINVHIPGDPQRPGKVEFTDYLASSFNPELSTIAMGDMNFNELEMESALQGSFKNKLIPFSLYVPYCTNICPQTFYAKAIDHFMVHLDANVQEIKVSTPEQLFESLEAVSRLLNAD